MTRSRRRLNSTRPGTATHTSAEWVFTRVIVLECPREHGHVLGQLSQDTGGTEASGHVTFAGPPGDVERSIRWTCPQCDARARSIGEMTRRGRTKRHESVLKSAPLLELLEVMELHGPQQVRVRAAVDSIESLTARIRSGEQRRTAEQFEAARVRRRFGPRGPAK